jgi:hypothetical protein
MKTRVGGWASAVAACLAAHAAFAAAAGLAPLAQVETAFADLNDAQGAIALLDSDLMDVYASKDRAAWKQIYAARYGQVRAGLEGISAKRLSPEDARALKVMRTSVEAMSETPDSLDLLTRMDEPQRRKDLFLAFVPLWQQLNGNSEPTSPYRRMIAMAAAAAKKSGSEIDAAARTLGTEPAEIESWLEQILDTWRQVSGETRVEPWDYRYVSGAAERELGEAIAREAMQPLNQRYYQDLGADLQRWNVLYDLDPRSGKAPLAYTDYVRRGRMVEGAWRPTVVRVSGNYARGGLGLLNELVHENGHVVHMMALHTRPAFMDLGDALFYEAFADVPSWSVYEPAWQQKYLGKSVSAASSLRALYSSVMLDVAWALFDLRMLRDPARDPNVVWTEITSRYLHVIEHPELAWWAVRVQLVDLPGYMVNYGLGSVVTADLRDRVAEQLGVFETGDARWYPWLADHLLESGQEQETVALLRSFLGRPVSPRALLAQLRRLAQ